MKTKKRISMLQNHSHCKDRLLKLSLMLFVPSSYLARMVFVLPGPIKIGITRLVWGIGKTDCRSEGLVSEYLFFLFGQQCLQQHWSQPWVRWIRSCVLLGEHWTLWGGETWLEEWLPVSLGNSCQGLPIQICRCMVKIDQKRPEKVVAGMYE